MSSSRRIEGFGWPPLRLARLTCLAAASLLAACESKDGSVPSQVVANVGGQEITELQVKQALERMPGLRSEQLEQASRQVLASLVGQAIVLQKARAIELDRDQRVVQDIERMKRDIVARAYLLRIAEGAAKPQAREIQAYYDANPALFKQRRIFTLQQVSFQASAAQQAEIEAQLGSLKSPADLEAYLKARQIAARSERLTLAAENIPLPLLPRMAALKPGQGLIVPGSGGLRILIVLHAEASPVLEEQARSAIDAFLLAQGRRLAIERELASLRSDAKVEYFGSFAGLAKADPPTAASMLGNDNELPAANAPLPAAGPTQ